jgi:hypothetical protein
MKTMAFLLMLEASLLVGFGIYIVAAKMSNPFGSMIVLFGMIIQFIALKRLI